MGAWECGSFDNDDAADWAAEFVDAPGKRLIQKTLKTAIESPEGELDAMDSNPALAACEVVAALRGAPLDNLPEELAEVTSRSRIKVDQALVDLALAAVERVRTDSETRDLWDEGDFEGWLAAIVDLEERLRREPVAVANDGAPRVKVKRARVGDVLRIPLETGEWGYGRVMEEGRMAFYDFKSLDDAPVDLDLVVGAPVLFYAVMMRYAFNGKTWAVVGHRPLEGPLLKKPLFLHNHSDIDAGEYLATTDWEDKIPVDYEIAKTLEIFSIYDPVHAEQRLNDHFVGRPNWAAERFRIVK